MRRRPQDRPLERSIACWDVPCVIISARARDPQKPPHTPGVILIIPRKLNRTRRSGLPLFVSTKLR